jgi:hypothetical protein
VDLCRRHLEQLREKHAPVEYESLLLTKHSEQRQIAWSCSAVTSGDGTLESIIATGVDINEPGAREAERAVWPPGWQVMARPAAERAGPPFHLARSSPTEGRNDGSLIIVAACPHRAAVSRRSFLQAGSPRWSTEFPIGKRSSTSSAEHCRQRVLLSRPHASGVRYAGGGTGRPT